MKDLVVKNMFLDGETGNVIVTIKLKKTALKKFIDLPGIAIEIPIVLNKKAIICLS